MEGPEGKPRLPFFQFPKETLRPERIESSSNQFWFWPSISSADSVGHILKMVGLRSKGG